VSRDAVSVKRRFKGSQFATLVVGLVTGAFVARLGLELTGRPWPWPLVITAGVLLAGLGALVARRLLSRRAAQPWWPLLLLAVYLFWPQRQPAIAMQLLALVGLTALLNRNRISASPNPPIPQSPPSRTPSWERMADISTFTLSLCFYVATTAPDVLPADSGEFQVVAPLLGVAHPPGYPLYTLLGRLFTLLIPFGKAAYRLNMMSAFLAAGTLTLLGAATRHWARRIVQSVPSGNSRSSAPRSPALVGGLAAALTLGTATTFWAQAGTANIRMPAVFLASVGLYALARHAQVDGERRTADGRADRWLWLLALALGLGLGHHPSLAFLGLFFSIYLVLIDPRLLAQPRRWWGPLLVALATLLPLLYLPLRGAAGAPLAPPNLGTLDGFWHFVTAQGFEGDMFAYANAHDLPQRLTLLPTLFRFQFNPALLAAAAFGLLLLAWRDRRLLTLLAGGLTLHTFVTITYRAPQTVEYLMPAYLPLAILVGLTTAWLLSQFASHSATPRRGGLKIRNSQFGMLLPAAILLAGIINGSDHGPSFFTLARDRSTRAYAESILDQAPREALILADWHWATPLWYLQWVEDRRPDVEVFYVYPVPGQEESDTWRERIEAAIGERPLLSTHFYDLPDYTLEPLGKGFWIHRRPYSAAPTGLSPLDALFLEAGGAGGDSGVRLLGYRLDRLEAEPGQTLELTLAWQAVGSLTAPPSFSVQMLADGDRRLAADDRYLGSGYTPGEIRFERLVLPLYPDVPPGDYRLALEVYSIGEDGFRTWELESGATRLDLTTLPLRPDATPPLSLHPLSIPFADGPTLVGVDYDRSLPGALRLYLHWRGPARGGERVHVGEGVTHLPPLPGDAYQTVVLDLPGETHGRPWLTLTDPDGQVKSAAGPWGWPLREVRLPAPPPTARFVPLGDEMALVGVAPARGKTVAPGDPLTLRLSFLALKPLLRDDGVSVRLLDGAGGLRDMHDLQPVLGAIPTLKWVRGSRVTDPHPLTVPDDLTEGVVRATMVVYERFRGTPLRPLDGRVGEVPLGEWTISGR
jgi:hypothetical protein